MRRLHFASALLIATFLIAHLANHVAMFWGEAEHRLIMTALRQVYRHPAVESVLLAALAWQLGSGLWLVMRGWRDRRGLVPWAQALSGSVVAMFIVVHVAAVLWGRATLGLDTNLGFAAAGMHAGYAAFFMPYYFLGVAMLGVHVAAALWWRTSGSLRRVLPPLVVLAACLLAGGFVAVMRTAVSVPDEYLATFANAAKAEPD